MYLFKTSGQTFKSVIKNQKHFLNTMPKNWSNNEIVIVSKNKGDCKKGEKQIQYIMNLEDIRPVQFGEISKYWPGNDETRWKYLVFCKNTKTIYKPFDLVDILGIESKSYGPIMSFRKVEIDHEKFILAHLYKNGNLMNSNNNFPLQQFDFDEKTVDFNNISDKLKGRGIWAII